MVMMQVGRIEFGNTKLGHLLKDIHEIDLERRMWENEAVKKDEEIEMLRERVNKLQDIVDKLGIKSQKKILKEFDRGRKKQR